MWNVMGKYAYVSTEECTLTIPLELQGFTACVKVVIQDLSSDQQKAVDRMWVVSQQPTVCYQLFCGAVNIIAAMESMGDDVTRIAVMQVTFDVEHVWNLTEIMDGGERFKQLRHIDKGSISLENALCGAIWNRQISTYTSTGYLFDMQFVLSTILDD